MRRSGGTGTLRGLPTGAGSRRFAATAARREEDVDDSDRHRTHPLTGRAAGGRHSRIIRARAGRGFPALRAVRTGHGQRIRRRRRDRRRCHHGLLQPRRHDVAPRNAVRRVGLRGLHQNALPEPRQPLQRGGRRRPDPRYQRRQCGWLCAAAHVLPHPPADGPRERGHRHERAIRARDRMGSRVGRTLPCTSVPVADHQHQPVDRREGDRLDVGRCRRQRGVGQRRPQQQPGHGIAVPDLRRPARHPAGGVHRPARATTREDRRLRPARG